MTREEKAIMYFKDMRKRICEDYLLGIPKDSVAYKATMAEKEFYDTAIKALEQEPCEDAISLKAVIEWLKTKDIIKLSSQEETARRELKALSSDKLQPCEDAISREPFTDSTICEGFSCNECSFNRKDKGGCILEERVKALPSIQPKPKTGHCKECKYFEYDSVAKVDGIPLIVAHEICKKWGDGCKTSEDGYCFLFEPQESEG